ncbi:hypothetical protein [Cytobacillus spongiae]|jgi:hypothetical protein|nr:hypothetical protein [Cytobacillus spongiae]
MRIETWGTDFGKITMIGMKAKMEEIPVEKGHHKGDEDQES